ncbi:MAG: hypothetical protein N3I35_03740 [Clostridia bacterium]|nr:hypothetical protein [Clostridia bacterium]
MQKKEYEVPVLKELGKFEDFTQNGWVGENFDGAYPEYGPEIYGS